MRSWWFCLFFCWKSKSLLIARSNIFHSVCRISCNGILLKRLQGTHFLITLWIWPQLTRPLPGLRLFFLFTTILTIQSLLRFSEFCLSVFLLPSFFLLVIDPCSFLLKLSIFEILSLVFLWICASILLPANSLGYLGILNAIPWG